MNIFVVTVHHKHGNNLYAAKTRAGIIKQLAAYCREWWGDAFSTKPPAKDEEVIRQYFDYHAGHESEYYEVGMPKLEN